MDKQAFNYAFDLGIREIAIELEKQAFNPKGAIKAGYGAVKKFTGDVTGHNLAKAEGVVSRTNLNLGKARAALAREQLVPISSADYFSLSRRAGGHKAVDNLRVRAVEEANNVTRVGEATSQARKQLAIGAGGAAVGAAGVGAGVALSNRE